MSTTTITFIAPSVDITVTTATVELTVIRK